MAKYDDDRWRYYFWRNRITLKCHKSPDTAPMANPNLYDRITYEEYEDWVQNNRVGGAR